MTASPDLHSAWAELFVRALAASGVTEAVVSPGSRSTPLALAFAASSAIRSHVVVDERSAAFFALGQARVTGRPSVLLATSGTAGAHYLPAILEARHAFVPLVVLTADRPWELREVSASQTIDQRALFGAQVGRFLELGLPDAAPAALRAVPRVAAQAVSAALGPVPGPVHVNASFRKPLEPVGAGEAAAWHATWRELMERGPSRALSSSGSVDPALVDEIAERMTRARRGLIVCGPAPLRTGEERSWVLALARRSGFPVLAEATSQLRFGDADGAVRISSFDALLRSPSFRRGHRPDFILQLGAPPVSEGFAALLAESPRLSRFVVSPFAWCDPSSDAEALVFAEPGELARAVTARLDGCGSTAWAERIARADARATARIARGIEANPWSEPGISRRVFEACAPGSILVLGNGSPVRDVDAFVPTSPKRIGVLHQRGVSGIDGLVSGASGASSVAGTPVTLLLGDLSLFHDLTGLDVLRRALGPIAVVVVQNGGGRIFEELPIGRGACDSGVFERFFATPTPFDLGGVAASFGIGFERVTSDDAFRSALASAGWHRGPVIVEAVVPPHAGACERARLRSLACELEELSALEEGVHP